jgi:putative membrane protein
VFSGRRCSRVGGVLGSAVSPGVRSAPVDEPDVRFTLANERTFLAWVRTSLALIAAGLAISQLLPPFDVPGGGHWLGIPLVAFGGLVAVVSHRRWVRNDQAIRRGEPLVRDRFPWALSLGVAAAALCALVLLVVGGRVS